MNELRRCRNTWAFCDGDCENCRTIATSSTQLAQPGQRNARVFQCIIVEYPSISAYPEYEGKPYFSIKYTENGQEFIGYGTYNPEVLSEYLKEYFMPPTQPGWIPVTERPPEEDVYVFATTAWNDVTIAERYNGDKWFINEGNTNATTDDITAWMPLPKPWEGGQDG